MPIVFQQTTNHHRHFDPIQLRRKQCSSTLIDEDIPILSNRNLQCLSASSSSSSGFRSSNYSRSSSIQTSSLVGCITNTDHPGYANIVAIESSNLWYSTKVCQVDLKRANVIKEIYKTEHDYLGHLKNLVDVS